MKMRFVFVIVTLFTINFIHLLVLRKWGMSEKVDKGIMMWYGKLSYRRKFIRTLWIIPIDIAIMFGFYYKFRSLRWTCIIAVILSIILFIQAFYNYKKWQEEIVKTDNNEKN